MADVIDKRMEQKVVNELLATEEVRPTEIHRRLTDVTTVRLRVRHFQNDETQIRDKPRRCRPATAVTAHNKSLTDNASVQFVCHFAGDNELKQSFRDVLQVQVRNFTTLVYSVLAFAEVC
jgi:hypothetical protein